MMFSETYSELKIHPVVALNQVAVVGLAVFQLDQHRVVDGRFE